MLARVNAWMYMVALSLITMGCGSGITSMLSIAAEGGDTVSAPVGSSIVLTATVHTATGKDSDVSGQSAWISQTPSKATIKGHSVLCLEKGIYGIAAAYEHLAAETMLTCTDAVDPHIYHLPTHVPVRDPIAPPIFHNPIISAPVTSAPVTSAPVTSAPITSAPITSAPITSAPITSAPITSAPITSAPITSAPITSAPSTEPVGQLSFAGTPSVIRSELPYTYVLHDVNPDIMLTHATWSVDAEVASVDPSGTVHCNHSGTATLTASIGNKSVSTSFVCLVRRISANRGPTDMEERFDGPFASWINAKDFGAKGDGITDDTAALQSAITYVAQNYAVLWLPHGTYRTTQTLHVLNLRSGQIVGEDPATTSIVWAGSSSSNAVALIDCSSCVTYTIKRLTLDGAGLLPIDLLIDGDGDSYSTKGSLQDLRLKGATKGILIGYAAEITIKRVLFDSLTAGLSVENWDVNNVNIIDSLFKNCYDGVTNLYGEGGFYVSNNAFMGSRRADISVGNAGVFAARNNVSVGSGLFFLSGAIEASSQLTIQNNEITASGNPLEISNPGTVSLIDNVFHVPATVPLLVAKGNYPIDILSIGNSFQTQQPYTGQIGRLTSYLEAPMQTPESSFQMPQYVVTPPQSGRPVFEVPLGASAAVIQNAIDRATANGSGVVHLPRGGFNVSQGLVVSGSSDISIVGDGYTALLGPANLSEPVLKITGKHVEVSDMYINAFGSGDAIRVEVPDAPGNSVLCDECHASFPIYGFVAEYLDNAQVEARAGLFNAEIYGVMVHGGPLHQQSLPALTKVSALMSSMGTYLVDMGGHLVVSDGFHDLHQGDYQFFVNGKGFLTQQGYATYTGSNHAMTLQNATGDITILGTQMDSMMVSDTQSSANILLAGSMQIIGKDPISLPSSSVNSMHLGDETNMYNGLSTRFANDSVGEAALERALSDSSTVYDAPKRSYRGALSRIRINKVEADFAEVGFHIVPASSTSDYQRLTISSALYGKHLAECVNGLAGTATWSLVDGHDGTYSLSAGGTYLGEAGGASQPDTQKVGLFQQISSSDQRWAVMPFGDGSFKLVNRASGKLVVTDGATCSMSEEHSGDQSQTWLLLSGSESQ